MAVMEAVPMVSPREEVRRAPTGVGIAVGPVVRVGTGLVVDIRLLNVDAPLDIHRRWRVVAFDDALSVNGRWRGAIPWLVEVRGNSGSGEQNEWYREQR